MAFKDPFSSNHSMILWHALALALKLKSPNLVPVPTTRSCGSPGWPKGSLAPLHPASAPQQAEELGPKGTVRRWPSAPQKRHMRPTKTTRLPAHPLAQRLQCPNSPMTIRWLSSSDMEVQPWRGGPHSGRGHGEVIWEEGWRWFGVGAPWGGPRGGRRGWAFPWHSQVITWNMTVYVLTSRL